MSYGQRDPMSGRMDNTPDYAPDYSDHPRTYECEARGCTAFGMEDDDGDMMECADCESRFCPKHITDDKDCHLRVCVECRTARDEAAPED